MLLPKAPMAFRAEGCLGLEWVGCGWSWGFGPSPCPASSTPRSALIRVRPHLPSLRPELAMEKRKPVAAQAVRPSFILWACCAPGPGSHSRVAAFIKEGETEVQKGGPC